VTAPAADSAPAALERLATALGPRFSTTLVTREARRPCLAVTSRDTAAGDNIYADAAAYWWSWVEWIASASDPLAAAGEISRVLGTWPEPSHG